MLGILPSKLDSPWSHSYKICQLARWPCCCEHVALVVVGAVAIVRPLQGGHYIAVAINNELITIGNALTAKCSRIRRNASAHQCNGNGEGDGTIDKQC